MKKLLLLIFILFSHIECREKNLHDNGPTPVAYTCPEVTKRQIIREWSPTVLTTLGLVSYCILYKPSLRQAYSNTKNFIATSPHLLTFSLGLGSVFLFKDYYQPKIKKLYRWLKGKRTC